MDGERMDMTGDTFGTYEGEELPRRTPGIFSCAAVLTEHADAVILPGSPPCGKMFYGGKAGFPDG